MSKLFGMVSMLSHQQATSNRRQQKLHALESFTSDIPDSNIKKSSSFRHSKVKQLEEAVKPSESEPVLENSDSQDSDASVSTPSRRKRANSFHGDKTPSSKENTEALENMAISKDITVPGSDLLMKQFEQEMVKIKQKENLLKEREAKLIQREIQLEKQVSQLSSMHKQAITPSALYSPDLTGRYKVHVEKNTSGFVENKKDITKPNWFDRLLDRIVGQSPENCYALICSRCCSHNGLLMIDDAETHAGYKCWNCGYMNIKQSSMSDSLSSTSYVEELVDDETNDVVDEEKETSGDDIIAAEGESKEHD